MNNNALEKQRPSSISDDARAIDAALARIGRTEAEAAPRPTRVGRIVFILDLTSSRKPSLLRARVATAAMFTAIKRFGSIALKLIYYRGFSELKATDWTADPELISRAMKRLSCALGSTQIARALRYVQRRETKQVGAIVFVGDHSEDDPRELDELAMALGRRRIPIFVFHEIRDDDFLTLEAKPIFIRMAELSGGAYSGFDPESASALSELLATVAAFSTAGSEGIESIEPATTPAAQQLQGRLLLGPGAPKR